MEIRITTPELPAMQPWRGDLSGWMEEDADDVAERVLRLFSPGGAMDDEAAMDVRVAEMLREWLEDRVPGLDEAVEPAVDVRIPALPRDPGEYLDRLEAQVVPRAVPAPSPRLIGHGSPAAPSFVPPLLRLATALGQGAAASGSSAALGHLERQALARLHRLVFAQPDAFYYRHAQDAWSTLGMMTAGGAMANVTALACARNRRLRPDGAFRGVEAAGMAAALAYLGCRGAAVIGSAQMDASFERAMGMLGLGTGHLYRVPTDTGGGVDLRAVRAAVDHCRDHHLVVLAVVGVAGSADAGTVDDLHALADLAEECGTHFHVDAAGGGAILFSDQHRPLLAGIERADTVSFDAHAQLHLPPETGLLFLRDPTLAAEIEPHAPGDAGRQARNGSHPPASLLLHAGLELIGERGYAFLAEEGIRKARYLADGVRARRELELLGEPPLNAVLFRFVPPEWRARVNAGTLPREAQRRIGAFNDALQRACHERGRGSVSRVVTGATVYGPHAQVTALRAVLSNPLTTTDDIDAVLDDLATLGSELSAAGFGASAS